VPGVTVCASRSADGAVGVAAGRLATATAADEPTTGRAWRMGSATRTASAAALAPSGAPGRRAKRRPMSPWMLRGRPRAKASEPGRARLNAAIDAKAPQPEC
jgi:hypothetical protein